MRSSGLREIHRIALGDPATVFIGSDLGSGVLADFRRELPGQFLMEGISEQLVAGMAAGLALSGKTVYVNTVASFLVRRCLDQIFVNVCLEEAKVRLFANGGGFIYGPQGPTHTITEDIALMMSMPGMAVVIPSDQNQMLSLLRQGHDRPGPIYYRVARDGYPSITEGKEIVWGRPLLLKPGRQFAFISNGYCTHIALKVAEAIPEAKVIDLHTLRPLDMDALAGLLQGVDRILTLEEHIRIGGVASLVGELLHTRGIKAELRSICVPVGIHEFYGEQDEHLARLGMDEDSCRNEAVRFFQTR
jgi:transketolase